MKTRKLFTFAFGLTVATTSFLSGDEGAKTAQAVTQCIGGKIAPYSVSISTDEWRLVKDFSNENKEDFVFCFQGLAYGNVRCEKVVNGQTDIKSQFVEALGQYTENIEIVSEETREVNGLKVLYMRLNSQTQGKNLVYDAQLYSGQNFNIFHSVVCQKDLYPQCEESIQHFLTSLQIAE